MSKFDLNILNLDWDIAGQTEHDAMCDELVSLKNENRALKEHIQSLRVDLENIRFGIDAALEHIRKLP